VIDVTHGESIEDGIGGAEVAPADNDHSLGSRAHRANVDEKVDRVRVGVPVTNDDQRRLHTCLLELLELAPGSLWFERRHDAVIGGIALAYLRGHELEVARVPARDNDGGCRVLFHCCPFHTAERPF
jgi:hypothetical protein